MTNKQHAKGTANKAKGEVKETVGRVTGNERLEAEGKKDKLKGEVQKRVGDAGGREDRSQGRGPDGLNPFTDCHSRPPGATAQGRAGLLRNARVSSRGRRDA